MLAFVNQAAPDIRKKLQKIERLNEQSLQDLVRAAERVFNHGETPGEREDRIKKKNLELKKTVKIKKRGPRTPRTRLPLQTVISSTRVRIATRGVRAQSPSLSPG